MDNEPKLNFPVFKEQLPSAPMLNFSDLFDFLEFMQKNFPIRKDEKQSKIDESVNIKFKLH